MALNPLRVRFTTTRRGEVHVSYVDEKSGDVIGFDLDEWQCKCLSKIIHATPTKGLEAVAGLMENAAGAVAKYNTEKLKESETKDVLGQIEGAEDYGTLVGADFR